MSKRKKPFLVQKVEIIDTANKGKSVAKYDDITVFIKGGVPGDICDVDIIKKMNIRYQREVF